jgi:nitrate reductase delta subunit
MKRTLRAMAVLLTYPSEDLQAHIGDLRSVLDDEGALSRADRRRLDPLLDRLASTDPLDAQEAYTELFDRSRALSLNLFEHVHGESRERGQAMIDLAGQYAAHGLMLDAVELPDHIPVFLEFASCLPPGEARETLAEPAHVLAVLQDRLRERGSDYAAVFSAVLALATARPDVRALDALRVSAPDDDPARIDQEWEDREISFAGAHEMGGPTGLVARIRANGKAANAARRGG